MRLSGEFFIIDKEGNEHCIPNQFTLIGMQQVLKSAFWGIIPTWYMGLCAHNPGDSIPIGNINEPTIGTNGYARVAVPLDNLNWPVIGSINGETYVETRDCLFSVAAEQQFDVQINRLFLTDGTNVIAISAAMEEGLHFVNADLTTKYRLYFR